MRRKNNRIGIIFVLLLLIIGIGYAILSANLSINGNAKINVPGWDVHFDNINVINGDVVVTEEPNLVTQQSLSFGVELEKPGDLYSFTVDVVNDGTIDAMIDEFETTGLSETTSNYVDYRVTYEDGSPLEYNDILASGSSETLRVYVLYNPFIESADLPESAIELELGFSLNYVQADENAKEINRIGNDSDGYIYLLPTSSNKVMLNQPLPYVDLYDSMNDLYDDTNKTVAIKVKEEEGVVTEIYIVAKDGSGEVAFRSGNGSDSYQDNWDFINDNLSGNWSCTEEFPGGGGKATTCEKFDINMMFSNFGMAAISDSTSSCEITAGEAAYCE